MHLQRSRLKIKSSGFKWGKREFSSRKKKISTGGMLSHRREYFTVDRAQIFDRFRERILLTRRDLETNYFVSRVSTEREATLESTGEQRFLLVHVKRFVPQNIEFVVYRRTTTPSHPRFTGINFRLSAINRPVYLGKLANQWKAGNIRDSIYNWAHCH